MNALSEFLAYVVFSIVFMVVTFIATAVIADTIARNLNASNFEGARDYGVVLIALLASCFGGVLGVFACNRLVAKIKRDQATNSDT